MKDGLYGLINHIVEKSGDATQQRKEQVKIGLLSQWMLDAGSWTAEFRNILPPGCLQVYLAPAAS